MSADQASDDPAAADAHADAAAAGFLASLMVPNRCLPHGTGWGGGDQMWPQKEGFAIRAEVERATARAITDVITNAD